MSIRLSAPIEDFDWKKSISQYFGHNPHTYRQFGLPGHNGIDIIVRDDKRGFGTPIKATHRGTVSKITYDIPPRS